MTLISRRTFVTLASVAIASPSIAHADPTSAMEATLAELPLSDGSVLRYSLAEAMASSGIPAISFAAISRFEIAVARAYGVTAVGELTKVTTRSLFQAASVSKPVTATGALALVRRGKLDLDNNVNDRLKSWQVPDNEFTAKEKVTLRRLMSHTAGLSVHGFPGYAIGAQRPTVQQILDGSPPANTAPVRVVFEPGSRQEYSGGGITVEQLMMSDVTGKAFENLMRDTVLQPMGMRDSTFAQPLPDGIALRTTAGTLFDGTIVPGRSHIYPEMAAAGLWTTPTDLARFAIQTARARLGQADVVLDVTMMEQMFQKVPNGDMLGFFSDPKNPGVFTHNGGNAGFRSLLIMNSVTGNGITVMTNADGGWGLMELLSHRIGTLSGWTHDFGGPARAVWLVAITNGANMALSHFEAVRSTAQESDLNEAGRILLAKGRTDEAIKLYRRNVEVYPTSGNVYDSLAWAYEVAGDKAQATSNYRLSLGHNPANENALERLKALE
ncbi:serine hydrolase [Asticcacaulis benevestitus]|nr:serine hydrolase [Asticcacaulis benevestitus]